MLDGVMTFGNLTEKVPSHSGGQNLFLITVVSAFQLPDGYFCWKSPLFLPWLLLAV